MSALWQWFVRFIGGFIPFVTKPFPEWAGKVGWVLGMFLIFNFVQGLLVKKPANNSVTRIVALPFSHIGNVDIDTDQKSVENKRKWWMPIPYLSVEGETERFSGGSSQTGIKAAAGVRLDF